MKTIRQLIDGYKKKYKNETTIVGSGILSKYGGLYLFVLSKKKFWGKNGRKRTIDYSCIGGKVESNETIAESAIRECSEEINMVVKIKSSKKTFYVDEINNISQIKVNEKCKPILLFERSYKGTPKNPNLGGWWHVLVGVYFADLKGSPCPGDIPAILCLNKKSLQKTLAGVSLQHILNDGGKIIEGIKIPRTSIIKPMFSPEIILKCNIDIDEIFRNKLRGGQ